MGTESKITGITGNSFLITPASSTGAPASGAHDLGETYKDSLGDPYLCIAAGTPGTWVKLAVATGVLANLMLTVSAGRDANATDIWLFGPDRIPNNEAPFRVPFAARLMFVSATTNGNETCDFEVYKNADVRAGGTPTDANKIAQLVFTAQQSGQTDLSASPVDLASGDEIGVFMRGTTVNRPRCDLILVRKF